MKVARMKKLYITFLLLSLTFIGFSQDNALLFLKGVPQTTQLNPAFRPIKGNYFSLPALGSLKLSGSNSGFSWSDIIRKGSGQQADSLIIDLDHVAGKLQDNNLFSTEATIQILGMGFYVGNTFVTFDMSHRFKGKFNYPASILDLRYGNWDYEQDRPINHSMSDLALNAIDYTEVALGFSTPINEDIIIGARFKYLFGIGNVKTENFNVGVETFEDGSMNVYSKASILTSMPLEIEHDEDGYVESVSFDENVDPGDLFTNNSQGMAVDLGVTWQVLNNLRLGAAINDLGFINWKTRTQRFYSDGTFSYKGVDLSDNITGEESSSTDYWEEIGDSIQNTFRVSEESVTYRTGLQGSFNLTADYQHRNWLNLGVVSRNYFVDGRWTPEFTLAAGLSPGKALSTVITYSMMKNAFANLGAGIALRGGPLQLYFVTDNLNSAMSMASAKYLNMRLGINLIFD